MSSLQAKQVTIIIPAQNEEASIGKVLDEIPRENVREIVVVNNNSSDDTAAVAARHGATVLHETRRGYGSACQRGIAHTDDATGIIVILDGDHSDFPDDLPLLLQPILDGDADLVIGSRVLGGAEKGALPWNQRWGNWLACLLMRVLYRYHCTDMGPFRAIRRSALLDFRMVDTTFGWNVEMLAKAVIAQLRIREVSVRYRPRIGTSKISGTVKGTVLAGTMIISTIIRYYPAYLRRGKS